MKKSKISIKKINDLVFLFKDLKKNTFFKKNKFNVLREFDEEKYSSITDQVKKNKKFSIKLLDDFVLKFKKSKYYFYKDNIFFEKILKIHKKNLKIHASHIKKFIIPSTKNNIVELGAGYGSKIINLKKEYFKVHNVHAFDFSKNSLKILNFLKKKIKINVGYCDFFSLKINKKFVPKNSIIFTSYALHYIPYHKEKIIDFFINLEPRIVIFFEPFYENYKGKKYFSYCRKYIKQNNYNKNLLKILKNYEKKQKIKIVRIEKNVFGINPLLPYSVVVWKVQKGKIKSLTKPLS